MREIKLILFLIKIYNSKDSISLMSLTITYLLKINKIAKVIISFCLLLINEHLFSLIDLSRF